ncbi:MAG: gamma-glutamyltransferase [Bacteroidetes bacterium]|nr:gamma-glutamyltransferase [Bacteroidota bacterium]MBU1115093.1 gamma-glutamyltransferase [Bacteroidota bacterium]MBU1796760.1 gamma-glutamyltransferase [Bacteroidota bacterium]
MQTYFRNFLLFIILISIPFLAKSKDPVRANNGMVVSASDIASLVGVEILEKGGNAIDAAVATGFALAVTYPQAGNIGGGGFMVIHLEDGTNTTIDYREKAPQTAFRDMFLNKNGKFVLAKSTEGWLSSGIPGSVAGMLYALEKYGTMTRDEILQPAIKLASNGFIIDYRFAEALNDYKKEFERYKSTKKIFTKTDEDFTEGELLVQKDLAKTLRSIKLIGNDGFYKGEVANLIAKQSKANGGFISIEDLSNYKPIERAPILGLYRNNKIVSMGPPSSGGIALVEALNSLEMFSFENKAWGSSSYIHTVSEVLKYVFADRAEHLGDMDFYPVPQKWLISKERGKEIAALVGDKAIPSNKISHANPPAKESEETTHFSVVDSYGNAVSVTTTLNSTFGNKIVVSGAGFIMNNEMDDFSAKPGTSNQYGLLGGEANSIEPNKRMLSAMTPTIILNSEDKPFMVIGSPGGSTIITTVLQVILNVIDFNMDIQEAIDAPRFHHQWKPDRIDFEHYGMTEDVKKNLSRKGQFIGKERVLGRAEGIIIDYKNNIIWGASDPRGYGEAAGY